MTTYMVEYLCDDCNRGGMVPTGQAIQSNPPRMMHVCQTCGAKKFFDVMYPVIQYEAAGLPEPMPKEPEAAPEPEPAPPSPLIL
jgi:hypothetical protein